MKAFSIGTIFVVAALLTAALVSCDNFQGDAQNTVVDLGPGAGASPAGASSTVWVGKQKLNGTVQKQGIFPAEFCSANEIAASTGQSLDDVSKTILPQAPLATSLKYYITAKVHEGTETVDTGTVQSDGSAYSIELPFAAGGTYWDVTIYAQKQIYTNWKTVLTKTETIFVDANTLDPTPFQLEYSKDSTDGNGTIELNVTCDTSSGVKSLRARREGSTGEFYYKPDATGKFSTLTFSVAPGSYKVTIIFYSDEAGTIPNYAIVETANVYANMSTSVLVGSASYIASGKINVTSECVAAMNNIETGGIYLGGEGIANNNPASDSNTGTAFAPVATLAKAFELANGLVAKNSTKTYTINVKGGSYAGKTGSATATLNSGAKVILKGLNAASFYKIYASTAGAYSISSSAASLECENLIFDKLGGITVAAGKMTMNNCKVTNGTSSANGTAGGITVAAGATFESTEGLIISDCANTSTGGGGIYCAGTLNLTGTTISGCKATGTNGCGGGIYVIGSGATMTLDGCMIGADSSSTASSSTLCSNYAVSNGGGIYIASSSYAGVTLQNSTKVSYNYAANGAGIYVDGGTPSLEATTVQRNGTASDGCGGGIYVNNGSLNISLAVTSTVTISDNTATKGGGIYNKAKLEIGAPTFNANTADKGSGIYYEGASSGTSLKFGGNLTIGTSESDRMQLHLANANSAISLYSSFDAKNGKIELVPDVAGGCTIGTTVISAGLLIQKLNRFVLPTDMADVYKLEPDVPKAYLNLKEVAQATVPEGDVTTSVGNGAFKNATTTPVHVRSIKMATYEVTYDLWYAVYQWAINRATNPYTFGSCGKEGVDASGDNEIIYTSAAPTTALVNSGEGRGGQRPVTNVSWRDAIVWCNAYSEFMGLTPVYYTDESYATPLRTSSDAATYTVETAGSQDCPYIYAVATGNTDMANCTAKGARLPTEAEWEFAARGGNQAAADWSYTYAGGNTVEDVAWIKVGSNSLLHCVGKKTANSLGLFDMSGNNSEWCDGWASKTASPPTRREKGGNAANPSDAGNLKVDYSGSSVPNRAGPRSGFRFVQNAD